jgi:hypothetical protein
MSVIAARPATSQASWRPSRGPSSWPCTTP